MKKFTLIVLLAFLYVSCEQVDELTQFDMSYDTSFTIPGTIGLDQ